MKHLLKGQIPKEYQLDYEITFTEQSATVYKKLIPELRLELLTGRVGSGQRLTRPEVSGRVG